jgi:hypothetical protein
MPVSGRDLSQGIRAYERRPYGNIDRRDRLQGKWRFAAFVSACGRN